MEEKIGIAYSLRLKKYQLSVLVSILLSNPLVASVEQVHGYAEDALGAGSCSLVSVTPSNPPDDSRRKPGHSPSGKEAATSVTPDLYTGTVTSHLEAFIIKRPSNKPLPVYLVNRPNALPSSFGAGWDLSLPYIQRDFSQGTSYMMPEFEFISASGRAQLVDIGSGRYRAKFESDFRKYNLVWGESGQSWIVKEKSGRVLYFGSNPTARLQAPSDGRCVYRWYLTKIEEENGELLELSYVNVDKNYQGSEAASVILEKIIYGKNSHFESVYDHEVRFAYKESQTPSIWLKPGFPVLIDQRLDSITVNFNGDLLERVDFKYIKNRATGELSIDKVTRIGKSGVSLKPTTVMYRDMPYSLDRHVQRNHFGSGVTDHLHKSGYLYDDFDGDGRADIAYIGDARDPGRRYSPTQDIYVMKGTADGYGQARLWASIPNVLYQKANAQWFAGDITGDSKADLVWFGNYGTRPNYYPHVVRVYPSNGESFLTSQNEYWNTDGMGYPGRPSVYAPEKYIADVNGDGYDDILFPVISEWTFHVLLSGPSKFLRRQIALSSNQRREQLRSPVVLDIDNDGRSDFVSISADGGVWVSKSLSTLTKAKYESPQKIGRLGNGDISRYCFTDFNNDQLVDIGFLGNGIFSVQFFDGLSFKPGPVSVVRDRITPPFDLSCRDVNGNGSGEVIVTELGSGAAKTSVHSIKANGAIVVMPPTRLTNHIQNTNNFASRLHVLDVDGSGASDLVYINPQGMVHLIKGDNPYPGLVKRLDSGQGSTTKIDYVNSSLFNNKKLPFNVPVVSRVESSDGLGLKEISRITYEGGYYQTALREFRGFSRVIVDKSFSKGHAPYRQEIEFHQGNWSLTPADPNGAPGVLKGMKYKDRIIDSNEEEWVEKSYYYKKPRNTMNYYSPLVRVETKNCVSSQECTKNYYESTYDRIGNIKSEKSSADERDNIDSLLLEYSYKIEDSDKYLVQIASMEKSAVIADGRKNLLSNITITHYNDPINQSTFVGEGKQVEVAEWVSGDNLITNRYELNKRGVVEKIIDNRGSMYELIIDDTGRWPLKIINPLGEEVSISYSGVQGNPVIGNSVGIITQISKKNGELISNVEYDDFGRVKSLKNNVGSVTQWSYFDNVDIGQTSVISTRSDGQTISYALDGYGRTIKRVIDEGKIGEVNETWRYLPIGKIVEMTSPSNNTNQITSFSYDYLGRPTHTNRFDGGFEKRCYGLGKVGILRAHSNDSAQKSIEYSLDSLGRISAIKTLTSQEALCGQPRMPEVDDVLYEYDALGRILAIVDKQGNAIRVKYDGVGRKLFLSDPNIGQVYWNYDDEFGEVEERHGSECINIDSSFSKKQSVSEACRIVGVKADSLGRPTEIYTTIDGKDRKVIKNLVYSARDKNDVSRLAQQRANYGDIVYLYDNNGRLERQEVKAGFFGNYEIEFNYDSIGRVTRIVYPDSSEIEYQYEDGLLVEVLVNGEPIAVVNSYSKFRRPNITSFADGTTKKVDYDDLGRISSIEWSNDVNDWYRYLSYDFDGLGRVIKLYFNNGTGDSVTRYEYDGYGRLVKVYDNGNVRKYKYDARGNIIEHPVYSDIIYNSNVPLDSPKELNNIVYSYDGEGRLIYGKMGDYEIHNEFSVDGTLRGRAIKGETTDVYIQTNNILGSEYYKNKWISFDENYFVTVNNIQNIAGLSIKDNFKWKNVVRVGGEVVAIVEKKGWFCQKPQTEYLHSDRLGSILFSTGNNGSIISDLTYDEFGNRSKATAYQPLLGFIGKTVPKVGGLIEVGARSYSPELAQFIAPDPIIPDIYDLQMLNRYNYSRNNPVSIRDSTGFFPESPDGSITMPIPNTGMGWVGVGVGIGLGSSFGQSRGSNSRGTSIAPARMGGAGGVSTVNYPGKSSRPMTLYSDNPLERMSSGISEYWGQLHPSMRGIVKGIGLIGGGVLGIALAVPFATGASVGAAVAAISIASGGMSAASGFVVATTNALALTTGTGSTSITELETATDQIIRYGSGVVSAHTSVLGLAVGGEKGAQYGSAIGGFTESFMGGRGAIRDVFVDDARWHLHLIDFMNNGYNGIDSLKQMSEIGPR